MHKIYTAEQTKNAGNRPFVANFATDDVMTASVTSRSELRGEVDGEESKTKVVAEVRVDYDVTVGRCGTFEHGKSRAILRKPDGASNPSIPLTDSPLPRKALLFNKLSQSKSLEFAIIERAVEGDRKSKSLADQEETVTSEGRITYDASVAKRNVVVNLREDGACVVTCTTASSPYVRVPTTQQKVSSKKPNSSPTVKRSMLSRIGRFITSPARRSCPRSQPQNAVKLLQRPALIKTQTGYKASLVCVARPREYATMRGAVLGRRDRPELRESSGYESFRNTDHTDASESADVSSDGQYII